MAIPAVKRRKMDPNSAQINEGYDIGIFINSTDANRYLCSICQCVFKQPYNIGCNNGHIFCKGCLDKYFNPTNSAKSCPECRQNGLFKYNIKPCQFVERLVNDLKVICPFQFQSQNENDYQCVWNGELNNLKTHIKMYCPLALEFCDYCNANMKRHQLIEHDNICIEKPLECDQCGQEIAKKLLQRHKENKCPMNMLSCDECKENVLRKNMEKHILTVCSEYEIMCEFQKYGCNFKVKRSLMNKHLTENEISHLKMKVNIIENELKKVKQNNILQTPNMTWIEYLSAQNWKRHERDIIVNSKQMKKCIISYMNGHNIIYENNSNPIYVNVFDMGMRILLKHKKIYKDTQFQNICRDWCEEFDIKMENLMIYNYTERKNKTLRTNRQIKLDLNEDNKNDDSNKYSNDEINNHKIATTEKLKYAKSIYDRIGNIMNRKRMFILFDKTKIEYLEGQAANNNYSKTILIALKYFDIFEQKLYFMDWLLIKTDSIKFSDIMKYIEQKLCVETKDKRSYFDVLYNYLKDMDDWERESGRKGERFVVYEEEAVTNDGECKMHFIGLNDIITSDYFDGDMFIFQLNGKHPYFNTLKTSKNEYEECGMYWYDNANEFLKSHAKMQKISINENR